VDEASGQAVLDLAPEASPGEALVAVAIDAAGAAGAHAFTYRVPDRLAPIEPGEAVVVEFGRRQALGIVLGPGEIAAGLTTKPIVDRVRGDGPLLPSLSMALAAWSRPLPRATGLVLRAMLPPGLLERLSSSPSDGQSPGTADDVDHQDAVLASRRGPEGRPPPRRARRATGLLRRLGRSGQPA
jgi:primosomal protein N'